MSKKDFKLSKVDVLDWLRREYGGMISSEITSICLCQDDESVWVEVTREDVCWYGKRIHIESTDLDVVADGEDGTPAFLPEADIQENARKLLHDVSMLANVTAVFNGAWNVYDDFRDKL